MKHTIIYITLFFILGLSSHAHSQQLQWQWAVQGSGLDSEAVAGMVCDDLGNIYITGNFADSVVFDKTVLRSTGETDIFLVKYDNAGTVLWAKSAGGKGRDYPGTLSITTDGKLYMAGTIGKQAVFDENTVGNKKQSLFMAHYTAEGELLWAQAWESRSGDYFTGSCVDPQGNAYLGGYFEKTLKMGEHSVTSSKKADAFVCRVDADGSIQWLKQWGGSGNDKITDLHYANQQLWITGQNQSTMKVAGYTISPSQKTHQSIFVIACNADGEELQAKKIAEGPQVSSAKIKQLENGHLLIAGSFANALFFDSREMVSYGNHDVFVTMTDTLGNGLWHQQMGSYGFDRLYDVIEHATENIIVTGLYSGTLFIDNDTTTFHSTHGDVFNLSINYEGQQRWVSTMGGGMEQSPAALTHDPKGNVYVAGVFRDTLKLNNSVLASPPESYNVFFAKLHYCDQHKIVFVNDTVFIEGTTLPLSLGGNYKTYEWDNGASFEPVYKVNCGQWYQVQVTDSLNCVYRDSIRVHQVPAVPKIQIRAQLTHPRPATLFSFPFVFLLKPEDERWWG